MKKAISPVVSVGAFLVVVVIGFFVIQSTLIEFSTSVATDYDSRGSSDFDTSEIKGAYSDGEIYLKNNLGYEAEILEIKVEGVECTVNSGSQLATGVNLLNVSGCALSGNAVSEVVVVTDKGVISKGVLVVQRGVVSVTPSGALTGYAWGENFGYISFSGTGYSVNLTETNFLTGFAYAENLGYISFNGSLYGVSVIGSVVDGYAWGENIGYINFNNSPTYQTTFNGSHLGGFAYAENFGYIHFNNSPTYEVTLS